MFIYFFFRNLPEILYDVLCAGSRKKAKDVPPGLATRFAHSGIPMLPSKKCKFPVYLYTSNKPQTKHIPVKHNAFLCISNLASKDLLWKNYQKIRKRFGNEEFDFLPETFQLPNERKLLEKAWNSSRVWIVKPYWVRLANFSSQYKHFVLHISMKLFL